MADGAVRQGIAALMAALVLLAGCVAPGTSGGGKMALFGGEIAVVTPAGYCVDTGASGAQDGSAVVLMGRCSGETAAAPALITMSLGGPGSSAVLKTGAKALSDYFLSPAGRAALARDGKARSVRVIQTSVAEGALMLRVADRSVGEYWRAVLGLKGRLVTISVTAPDPETGRRLLEATMAAMRRANPGGAG